MNKNLSNEIKNLIIVFLSDGKLRHVNEIKKFLKENGIDVYDNSSIFRNALFNLKKENPLLTNPKRGFYQLTQNPHTESNSTNSANLFEDFETVTKTTRKQPFLVVSILKDGTFSVNSCLLSHFSNASATIKIKKDASQIALLSNGDSPINLGKGGRTKNYYILNKLQKCHKKLPAYYIGEWNSAEGFWLGKFSTVNPNTTVKSK